MKAEKQTKMADLDLNKELEHLFIQERLPQPASEFLLEYHNQSFQALQSLPFPNRRDEAWRRTDLRKLTLNKFKSTVTKQMSSDPVSSILERNRKNKLFSGEIIISEKKVSAFLCEEAKQAGVIFTDLRTAENLMADKLEGKLGEIVKPDEGKFAALASAFAQDGIFLFVPKNVQLTLPFYSKLSGAASFSSRLTHLLIWLESGASITYINEYHSSDLPMEKQALHAGVTEIFVGENAHLNFTELQNWGKNVWSFIHERFRIYKDGQLELISGTTGGNVSKEFLTIDLVEQGAEAKASGFYISDQEQHFDLDTQQNHLAPSTTSDLTYKGVLLDKSKTVWQGMVYVAPHAIKTDGYQLNKNLILSNDAKARSIPGLEILADDVRCSHGATVSKIEDTEMFYLQSRGIPKREAEKIIVNGFLGAVLEHIPQKEIVKRYKNIINKKIDASSNSYKSEKSMNNSIISYDEDKK